MGAALLRFVVKGVRHEVVARGHLQGRQMAACWDPGGNEPGLTVQGAVPGMWQVLGV